MITFYIIIFIQFLSAIFYGNKMFIIIAFLEEAIIYTRSELETCLLVFFL